MIKKILLFFFRYILKFKDKYINELAGDNFKKLINYCGSNLRIKYPYYLKGGNFVNIGDNFSSGPMLRIECWDRYLDYVYSPEIHIGNNVKINYNVHIGAANKIVIGNNVLIGSNVLIIDCNHGDLFDNDFSIPYYSRPLISKGPTIIEDNVWIGEGACILPGVKVGKNSIIGANSVVINNIKPGYIAAGIPAKILRKI